MTAIEVLNRVLKAGGHVIPDPERARLLVPQNLKPIVHEHREALRYWEIEETEPIEIFNAAHRKIASLETQAAPEVAWYTLRDAATAYHAETGLCPFCRERGPLHLPAEQISGELLSG